MTLIYKKIKINKDICQIQMVDTGNSITQKYQFLFIYLFGTNSIESANIVYNLDPRALGIMECSWVKGENYKQSYIMCDAFPNLP